MAQAKKGTSKSKAPSWQNSASVISLVIGIILIPFAVIAIWLHNTIFDIDTYITTVAPLSFNETIANDIASNITNRFFQKINASNLISSALPEQGQFLVTPLLERLETFTQTQISQLIQSEEFNNLWIEANRLSQPPVVKLLTGGGEAIQAQQGIITLNLGPIINQLKSKLSQKGITIFNDITFAAEDEQIVIFQSSQLANAQAFISRLNQMVVALSLLVLTFLAAAVILSINRLETLYNLGIGISVAGVALLLLILIQRTQYINSGDRIIFSPAAASAFYDTVTRFLFSASWIIIVIGLLTILAVSQIRKNS